MSSDLPDGLLGSTEADGSDRDAGGESDEEENYLRYLFLRVGDHRLAIPVEDVRAITDRPAETTRIPRTPAAIDGVTDLRGQITVVIDPHVHFPDAGERAAEPVLLVFDRDDQPAAIAVEEVLGVESVPEADVLDVTEFDPGAIEGTPLAHPLIVGVVRQERQRRESVRETIAAGRDPGDHRASGSADRAPTSLFGETTSTDPDDEFGVEVDEFSLDEETEADEPTESAPEPSSPPVEIEVAPLLDVDRLLLASGRLSEVELETAITS